jgi:hypothetical protein
MGKHRTEATEGNGGLDGGDSFHEHRGFRAKNKPTLSFTGVFPIKFSGHQPKSPSVASVRCFPVEPVSPPRSHGVTDKISVGINQIPSVTSVTSVRCLHPMRAFPAQKSPCPPKAFRIHHADSPSVTSVTSVRCLHPNARFPPRSHPVHPKPFASTTPIPPL